MNVIIVLVNVSVKDITMTTTSITTTTVETHQDIGDKTQSRKDTDMRILYNTRVLQAGLKA